MIRITIKTGNPDKEIQIEDEEGHLWELFTVTLPGLSERLAKVEEKVDLLIRLGLGLMVGGFGIIAALMTLV